jgi:hypothetical protein
VNSLSLLALVIITVELFSLYALTARTCRGYFLIAIRNTALFLLVAVGLRWVFAAVLLRALPARSQDYIWTALIGILVVAAPHALEGVVGKVLTVDVAKTQIIRLIKRFNLLSKQFLLYEIQRLKAQDNYDYQNSKGWWNLGLPNQNIGRHIRMIYETCKEDIAKKHRKKAYTRHDVDIPPGQKFYLLVEQLGRRELRRRLKDPPAFEDWDGSERRRKNGTPDDRTQPDPEPHACRRGDNR